MKRSDDYPIWVYSGLALVVLLWGLVPLVMKTSALKMQPGTFSLLRFLLSSAILGGLFFRDVTQLGKGDAARLMALGGFTLLPFSYFFLAGVKYVDISTAGMIQGTIPGMTILMSSLLTRSLPSRMALLGVAIAYCGLVLFLGPDSGTLLHYGSRQAEGIGYLVVAMACFSLYTILGKRTTANVRNSVAILYASIGAAIGSIPLSLVEYQVDGQVSISWAGFIGAAYMAFFGTAVSFILYTKAVRTIGPFPASIFTNFVPIVIILSGVIALGERISAIQLGAICIVVAGIVVSVAHGKAINIKMQYSNH